MVDYFNNLYSSIKDNNALLAKLRFYSVLRLIVRTVANFVLPLYFKSTANDLRHSITNSRDEKKQIIVSLTSFPTRIDKVWLAIETILRQSHKPTQIILWLSKEQFSSVDDLPKQLL